MCLYDNLTKHNRQYKKLAKEDYKVPMGEVIYQYRDNTGIKTK